MKRTGTLIILFLFSVIIQAQEDYKKSLNGIKQVRIQTDTSVKITSGGSNELVLSNGTNNNHKQYDNSHWQSDDEKTNRKDKAKGLKAIYAGGIDNTGFGMSIEVDGDVLRIRDLKSFTQRNGFIITLPKNIEIYLDCGNLGSAEINGFSSEIEVETNVGTIDLIDVSGPITARTSTGTINVKFVAVNQSSPISISSATGDIDVSLPSNTKADLELKTTMGTVYSDFDLEIIRKDGMKRIGALRKIESKLNNGGVKIYLKSSTGDVYLRKN